jgi:hypothetical protein
MILELADVDQSGARTQWILRGEQVASTEPRPGDLREEHELFERDGFVKLVECPEGTTVMWSVFAPNWASLYAVMDRLDQAPAPVTLKYFLSGWFVETLPDSLSARRRIHTILAKSDIHLTSRTYVRPASPNRPDIPPILKQALEQNAPAEFGIDCVYDSASGRFSVERVGRKSEIARVWGMSPVSYPCINGLTYDQVVSAAYHRVLTTGEPHYDHVLAAMVTPASDVFWYPYQRVILPGKFAGSRKGVFVVSKQAPVDIRVV